MIHGPGPETDSLAYQAGYRAGYNAGSDAGARAGMAIERNAIVEWIRSWTSQPTARELAAYLEAGMHTCGG